MRGRKSYLRTSPWSPVCSFLVVSDSVTPWTAARQAPLSMGFSRQEYWSGFPLPPPEDLPDLGMELASPSAPALQAGSLPLSYQGSSLIILGPMINNFPGDFSGGPDSKESACDVEDLGLIPGLRRSPGGGHGNPLQYSFLETPMDGGTW